MRKCPTALLAVVDAVRSSARLLVGASMALFVVGAVPLAAPRAAHAAKVDNATEMKAREAFAAGRYDEALDLFAKLYAQTLHPVYLRNIGRCHQKLRQPEPAIDKFNEYLVKEKKISADERNEINGYIKEMETLRDEQARQSTPPASTQSAQQQQPVTPIANNPPPNYYPPPPTSSGTLIAQPPPHEDEAPVYKKWWFWTGIGAVVVGTVIIAVVLSSSSRPDCVALQCM